MGGWIFKTEPDVYSIQQLAAEKQVRWDGVRNYQARNFLRDQVLLGAPVALWHSNSKVPGVVGLAKVVRAAYADPTAFDPEHDAYDPKSKLESPTWISVDVAHVSTLTQVIPASVLREDPLLKGLLLFRQGRLSVSPVELPAWKKLCRLAHWG